MYRERDRRGLYPLQKSVSGASLAAAEWMEWTAKREDIRISHIFNGKTLFWSVIPFLLELCLLLP